MDNSKTASRQAARKRRLLINRDFTLLWSAQAISKLGDVVFDYTLVFWIATSIAREQRWAPLAVSGIFVATALPTLGAGPIAGVFVDRWQKRPTMLLMDALRAILILLLLLATGIPPLGSSWRSISWWSLPRFALSSSTHRASRSSATW